MKHVLGKYAGEFVDWCNIMAGRRVPVWTNLRQRRFRITLAPPSASLFPRGDKIEDK